jgi:hypothetical protein
MERVLSLTSDVLQVAPLSRYSMVFLNLSHIWQGFGSAPQIPWTTLSNIMLNKQKNLNRRHCISFCDINQLHRYRGIWITFILMWFRPCIFVNMWNKMPTRCNRWFLLQILSLAQHVSGTTTPIIRSSRVLYRWFLPVVFGALVFKLSVWCGAEGYVSGLRTHNSYRNTAVNIVDNFHIQT